MDTLDLWNFKDTLLVGSSNALWIIVALALGAFVGWSTYDTGATGNAGEGER